MKKDNTKMFILRKYVRAKSASDAIRKDKQTPVDDVWVDDDWKKQQNALENAIGFTVTEEDVK
jgi:hypothetical protein